MVGVMLNMDMGVGKAGLSDCYGFRERRLSVKGSMLGGMAMKHQGHIPRKS